MNRFGTLLLLIFLPVSCASPQAEVEPISVPVAVINFDPVLESGQRMHEAMGWNDPWELAQQYMRAVREVSHGRVVYEVSSWLDEDAYPVKVDGFVYTDEQFLRCQEERETCHDPDGTDYARLLDDYDIARRLEGGEFEELWIFGAPYMGFWESAMAGPDAFYINGGVYDSVALARPLVVMGFSYERGLAEMLHNLCHRTEATMEKVSGGWDSTDLSTDWARFAANAHQSGGVAAVGSCHYPPNGTRDYDYANPDSVVSSAESWREYPRESDQSEMVSAETWGGPDFQLNYLKWWYSHLPHGDGTAPSGMLANWWRYVFDYRNTVIGHTDAGDARGVAD